MDERMSGVGPFEPFIFTRKTLKTVQNRSNRVSFNKIWLLSMRRLAQNSREIRMPADLADRFFANMTLQNAKKTRADFERPGGYRRMMTAVCSQTLAALRPGGVAAVVVRDYVRDGKRVPFADEICELLRAIGFEIFQRTHCMMVNSPLSTRLPAKAATLIDGHDGLRRIDE
jgi:hypothetical protein